MNKSYKGSKFKVAIGKKELLRISVAKVVEFAKKGEFDAIEAYLQVALSGTFKQHLFHSLPILDKFKKQTDSEMK